MTVGLIRVDYTCLIQAFQCSYPNQHQQIQILTTTTSCCLRWTTHRFSFDYWNDDSLLRHSSLHTESDIQNNECLSRLTLCSQNLGPPTPSSYLGVCLHTHFLKHDRVLADVYRRERERCCCTCLKSSLSGNCIPSPCPTCSQDILPRLKNTSVIFLSIRGFFSCLLWEQSMQCSFFFYPFTKKNRTWNIQAVFCTGQITHLGSKCQHKWKKYNNISVKQVQQQHSAVLYNQLLAGTITDHPTWLLLQQTGSLHRSVRVRAIKRHTSKLHFLPLCRE